MGKEQELLEAARSGNLSVVERILSQRAKKTGPLASLRRGPGANTQDQSGYTSLHHSALNGHKDIVSLLLAHEASTNVVDHKGSAPLHLAAWTGNTEIVKLLLVAGSSQPNVNLANHDRETALHSAAQYGHTEVVVLLLQHNSDPSVRNLKDESPLDLAAQYGRLDTVELLVKAHPELLHDNVRRHSPLHLAARNGHRQVCKVLLDAGFDVNYLTDNGSALHEAALYGKVEVVKLLLEYGVDANLENCQRRTVFDLLEDLNTAIAKQIWRIIKDHSTLVSTDDDITESPSSISPPPGFLSSGHYANVLLPDRYSLSPPRQMSSPASDISFYEVPASLKPVNTSQISSGTASDFFHTPTPSHSRDSSFEHTSPCSRSPSLYETPPPPRDVEPPVVSSSFQSPYDARLSSFRSSRSSDSEALLYEIPPPPPPSSAPGNRFSDPLQQGATYQNIVPIKVGEKDCKVEDDDDYDSIGKDSDSGATDYDDIPEDDDDKDYYEFPEDEEEDKDYVDIDDNEEGAGKKPGDIKQEGEQRKSVAGDSRMEQRVPPTSWSSAGSYIPMAPLQSHNKPQPPAKPPRRSIAAVSPDSKTQASFRHHGTSYEFLCLATSGLHHSTSSGNFGPADSFRLTSSEHVVRRPTATPGGSSTSEYVDMKLRTSMIGTYENHMVIMANSMTSSDRSTEGRFDSSKSTHWTYVSNGRVPDPVGHFGILYDDLATTGVGSGRPPGFNALMPSKSTPALHAARHMLDQVVPISEYRLKPNSLDLRPKRATVQIPLSPTNYQQPPTPDFPPPSPATAESGILEKIRPLSKEDEDEKELLDDGDEEYKSKKRNSCDIETLTEEQLFAAIDDDSGEIQLILGKENKSVATDIEEVIGDDPFAGLCRGSTAHSEHSENSREKLKIPLKSASGGDIKPPVPRRTRNIYENVNIEMEPSGRNKVVLQNSSDGKSDRRSGSLSVMSPFDENAEWAEIADIMASFGSSITRESVFARELEPTFANTLSLEPTDRKQPDNGNYSTIEQWLSSIGLPEYENLLIINGFDDINFMGGTILEDQDLKDIGISNADHRQKLVASSQKLPCIKPIGKGENKAGIPTSVDQWLSSLNLKEYQETFRKNGFTDIGRVLKLWEVELNTVLEISKVGHQKRILASLGEKTPDRFFNFEELDLSKLNLRLSELGIDNDTLAITEEEEKHNNYASVNTKKVLCSSTSGTPNHHPNESSKETLRIRPPTQLMSEPGTEEESPDRTVGVPSMMAAQWRHEPEALINNCCNYSAKYLGSTLVKELKGMESTRKSIQKLKASTREIGKIPNVILSISYTGVKFIDAQTQQLVCEHEIRNIHCACQDADDLNHFAYITKEHQTRNHYCHVFCAQTMDLATEIILTLGQAFEVAYQLALREKAEKPSQQSTVQTVVNSSNCQKSDRNTVAINSGHLSQKSTSGGNSALEMLLKERTKL